MKFHPGIAFLSSLAHTHRHHRTLENMAHTSDLKSVHLPSKIFYSNNQRHQNRLKDRGYLDYIRQTHQLIGTPDGLL
jgi:hypothetical protein